MHLQTSWYSTTRLGQMELNHSVFLASDRPRSKRSRSQGSDCDEHAGVSLASRAGPEASGQDVKSSADQFFLATETSAEALQIPFPAACTEVPHCGKMRKKQRDPEGSKLRRYFSGRPLRWAKSWHTNLAVYSSSAEVDEPRPSGPDCNRYVGSSTGLPSTTTWATLQNGPTSRTTCRPGRRSRAHDKS